MGLKRFNSFSLLSLAIFGAILLSQGLVEARGSIGASPYCRNARFVRLCNRMVSGAPTPREASLQSLRQTRAFASRLPAFTQAVSQVVSIGIINPQAKDGVIKQCTEVFQDAVDNLDQSIVAVEAGDIFTAATRLSAISFSDCSDAMEQFGVTLPMKKLVVRFQRHVSNCLAVVQV